MKPRIVIPQPPREDPHPSAALGVLSAAAIVGLLVFLWFAP
jgi:hypothetical protein